MAGSFPRGNTRFKFFAPPGPIFCRRFAMERVSMYSNKPIEFYKNRRTKPDFIIKWLEAACVLVWFIFMFNLCIIVYAGPGKENFFDRLFNVKVRDYWDYRYLWTALLISIAQFILSSVSVYLNTRRLKRKYDKLRPSLWISALLSLACIIILIIVLVL
jgi:hypothetical protein